MSGVLLRTRLRPPRIPGDAVDRPRLIAQGALGIERGQLLVVAPAGYGKSVFLAQLARSYDAPIAWCSCDARMKDAQVFFVHVRGALGEAVPGFGAGVQLNGSIEEQVAALSNELDRVASDPVALMLDDVHLLADGAAEGALEALLDAMPATVSVAIAARAAPRLPLSRMRISGLVEIGAADLAFDEDEAGALLAHAVHSPELIRTMHSATEGWVAGLVVAGQAGHIDADAVGAIGEEGLFAYLADEVLARRSEEELAVMEAMALLSRFTAEMAPAVARIPDASSIVERLIAGQTLVIDLGGGWYRYHHLLQAHLRGRAASWPDARRRAVEAVAGEEWRARGEHLEAARHFLRAGEPERAGEVLLEVAEAFARGPEGPELGALLEQLPDEVRQARPDLVFAHGAVQYAMARHQEGYALAEQAIERLIELGEHERAAQALILYLMAMNGAGAVASRRAEAGDRFLPRIGPSPTRAVCEAFHAGNLAYSRQQKRARAALASAREAARPGGPPIALCADIFEGCYLDIPEGRFTVGIERLLRADEALEDSGDPFALDLRMLAAAYIAFWLNNRGRYRQSLDWTERLLGVARRRGITSARRASAGFRMVALAGLERFDELEEILADPSLRYGDGTIWGYRQRAQSALLAAHKGDAAEVVAELEAALPDIRSHLPVFDYPWTFCDFSTALLQVGLRERAAELAREALATAEEIGLPWDAGRARIRLALSGEGEEARDALEVVLRQSVDASVDELWTRRERGGAPELLARAIRQGIGPEGVAARLTVACGGEVAAEVVRRCRKAPEGARVALLDAFTATGPIPDDVRAALSGDESAQIRRAARGGRAAASDSARAPLSISGFDGLVVERGGVPVPRRAFGRDKARQLLAALLAARGPLHRDRILEWLWPDLPPDRGARAFHVTLHGLRKALEPDRPRRAVGSLVSVEGETYRVVLGEEDRFDIGEYLELADPERAHGDEELRGRLVRALSVRRGDPFPEWPYAAWAEALVADVDRAARRIRGELARIALAGERPREAAEHLEALVALEPEREDRHRALMRAYAAAGERAMALRQFHACRTVLRRELAIDAGHETRELYVQILNADEAEVAWA